jgi:hypothetical protein
MDIGDAEANRSSIEERVQRLERFRYRTLGMIKSRNVIIADLICDWLIDHGEHHQQALEMLGRNWHVQAEQPTAELRLIDPAEGDLISREYHEAKNRLATTIAARLRRHRAARSRECTLSRVCPSRRRPRGKLLQAFDSTVPVRFQNEGQHDLISASSPHLAQRPTASFISGSCRNRSRSIASLCPQAIAVTRHHHFEHRVPEKVGIATIRHRFREPPAYTKPALRFPQQQQTGIGGQDAAIKIHCFLR